MAKQISLLSQSLIVSSILGLSWLPLGLAQDQLTGAEVFKGKNSVELRLYDNREVSTSIPEPRSTPDSTRPEPKPTPDSTRPKPRPTPDSTRSN